MKVKARFLVTRTPDGVYDAQSIGEDGAYDEVMVEYSPDYVTKKDLIEYGKKYYGDRFYSVLGRQIELIEKGMCFTIQGEARHLPNLGKMKLSFEEIEVDIN